MSAFVMGVDFGSTTGKAVILDETGEIRGSAVSSKGAVSDEGVQDAMRLALEEAGIRERDLGRAVATGYGRRMLDVADRSITEITCHARGAVAMVPDAALVIDIGGQDSKVIAIDPNGLVQRFVMNDRCAAGTGKFLETLARAVDVPLDEMGPRALQADGEVQISAMCATFAETEVIGLLSEGASKTDVLGGVHAAVAKRTAGMVSRVGKREPVVMTGGVANNVAAVKHLEDELQTTMVLPERPQLAGALGAALFALDDLRSEGPVARRGEDPDDAVEADLNEQSQKVGGCGPACPASTGTTTGGALPMAGAPR
jgi:(R)-2-hydroxyacyl-CoA dehydratese activating ATPase